MTNQPLTDEPTPDETVDLVGDFIARLEDSLALHLSAADVDVESLAGAAGEITINDLLRGAIGLPAENREALAVELLAMETPVDDYGADRASPLEGDAETTNAAAVDKALDRTLAETDVEGTPLDATNAALTAMSETGDNDEARVPGDGSDDDFFDPLGHLPFELALIVMDGYVTPPDLVWDGDIDRLISRQQALMDARYDGIGEERQVHKRRGLANQQMQLEQQMALRLALGFGDLEPLLAHLTRCLADPDYGYGERGDNGRLTAQMLAAIATEEAVSFETMVADWFETSRVLYQQARHGLPILIRPPFDETTLDTFVPVLTCPSEDYWRLGDPARGKTRDFEGHLLEIWGRISDTLVEWMTADNEKWLAAVKRRAEKLPDHLAVAAWADTLLKETYSLAPESKTRFVLHRHRLSGDAAWPRFTAVADKVGLLRLSGHGFYEVAWGQSEYVRRFELSSTRQRGLPVEHVEIAVNIARVLAEGAEFPPASPEAIEVAYLRRIKATAVELGPPPAQTPLGDYPAIAGYTIHHRHGDPLPVTIFQALELVAFAPIPGRPDEGMALKKDPDRNLLGVWPVRRGVLRRPLLTGTPLQEVGKGGAWMRALCAWLGWVAHSRTRR